MKQFKIDEERARYITIGNTGIRENLKGSINP